MVHDSAITGDGPEHNPNRPEQLPCGINLEFPLCPIDGSWEFGILDPSERNTMSKQENPNRIMTQAQKDNKVLEDQMNTILDATVTYGPYENLRWTSVTKAMVLAYQAGVQAAMNTGLTAETSELLKAAFDAGRVAERLGK